MIASTPASKRARSEVPPSTAGGTNALQLLRQREEELEQVRREAEEARLKHHREAGEERQHTLREKHLAEEAVLQRDFKAKEAARLRELLDEQRAFTEQEQQEREREAREARERLEELRERLGDGSIRLVRCAWLQSDEADAALGHDEAGAPIVKRRQELPQGAFVPAAEAVELLRRDDRSVLVLSYAWQTPNHPDPHGTTLNAVRTYLTEARDVDGCVARCAAMTGVRVEQRPAENARFGIYNALMRDPDGYLVEVQQFLDASEHARFGGP